MWKTPTMSIFWKFNKKKEHGLFFSILWGRWTNNHPEEDIAKFG
jgi:hypothetical protein